MAKHSKAELHIVDIFSKQKMPISVLECMNIASEEGIYYHKTTFYRAFHRLIENSKISLSGFENGEQQYMLANNHTHTITCQSCKTETPLESSILDIIETTFASVEQQLQTSHKFDSVKHILQFSGRCNSCQAH